MSAPQALIEFFQKEATEYLDRLDQLLAPAESTTPDAGAFLTHARALRGSATMTRLEGLPDLAGTVERIATGLARRRAALGSASPFRGARRAGGAARAGGARPCLG